MTRRGSGREDEGMVVLLGVVYGLVVLISGLLFAIGLFGRGNPVLIGVAFALLAACAVVGTQADWPRRESES